MLNGQVKVNTKTKITKHTEVGFGTSEADLLLNDDNSSGEELTMPSAGCKKVRLLFFSSNRG